MTTISGDSFGSQPDADRNAFLVLTALVWLGILGGFGIDSVSHVLKYGLDYPLIVHIHAVAFVSYAALFTVQVLLIRNARTDLHRRLGVAGALLMGVMLVLGPTTAILFEADLYNHSGQTPEFLSVPLAGTLAFGTLGGAGLLLRGVPAAHKRLMMLALISISDAGFARLMNGLGFARSGDSLIRDFVVLYSGSDLIMLGLGIYDLVVRRTLHPAYIAGAIWLLTLQLIARAGLHNPAWKAFSLHLIGH